jgi:hypothetical protein
MRKKNTTILEQGRVDPWTRVIFGSPQSKANSRRLVMRGDKPSFIKGKAALSYLSDFLKQCPVLTPMFEDDVAVRIDIYYQSRRNDVDDSLILDAMQGRIYRNDRQVRQRLITGYVDKENPRAEIYVRTFIQPDQPNDGSFE